MAIADIYDAMTSRRPYHAACSPPQAMHWIFQNGRTHVDASLALTFIENLGIYPVGTLVRLSTNELAVVAKANPQAVHCPRVVVFGQSGGVIYEKPRWLDLVAPGRAKRSPHIVEAFPLGALEVDLESYLVVIEPEMYSLSHLDSQA